MSVMPPYNIGGPPNSRFLGMPLLQNRFAVPAWSYLFERWQPGVLVELGSWTGGLTCCLGMAGKMYGFPVHSYDRCAPAEELRPWFQFLGIHQHCADIFSMETRETIARLIVGTSRPALILCDGGNKVLEFTLYADLLKKGDVIAAHDYSTGPHWPWSEVRLEQVMPSCEQHSLGVFFPTLFHNTGWLVRRKTA